jgi:hypothetical protein
MPTKLELYGIALLVLAMALGGAYFKGRLDAERAIAQKQLADNAEALQRYAKREDDRAAADDLARQKTVAFMGAVEQGITNANAQFSKLVAVDNHGCERLTDDARLRWNAIELLPAGSAHESAGKPIDPVPAR